MFTFINRIIGFGDSSVASRSPLTDEPISSPLRVYDQVKKQINKILHYLADAYGRMIGVNKIGPDVLPSDTGHTSCKVVEGSQTPPLRDFGQATKPINTIFIDIQEEYERIIDINKLCPDMFNKKELQSILDYNLKLKGICAVLSVLTHDVHLKEVKHVIKEMIKLMKIINKRNIANTMSKMIIERFNNVEKQISEEMRVIEESNFYDKLKDTFMVFSGIVLLFVLITNINKQTFSEMKKIIKWQNLIIMGSMLAGVYLYNHFLWTKKETKDLVQDRFSIYTRLKQFAENEKTRSLEESTNFLELSLSTESNEILKIIRELEMLEEKLEQLKYDFLL